MWTTIVLVEVRCSLCMLFVDRSYDVSLLVFIDGRGEYGRFECEHVCVKYPKENNEAFAFFSVVATDGVNDTVSFIIFRFIALPTFSSDVEFLVW